MQTPTKRKLPSMPYFSGPLNIKKPYKRKLVSPSKKKFRKRARMPMTPRRVQVQRAKIGMSVRKGYLSKRKPSKKLGKTMGMKTTCQKLGFVENTEYYGVVEDLSCVYLGHSTYDLEQYARVISVAICRKLVQLAGVHVSNLDDSLDWSRLGTGAPTSLGIRLILDVSNNEGQKLNATVSVGSTDTLNQLTYSSTVYETVRNLMRDGKASHATFDKIQLQYQWRENETSANQVWRTVAEINFKTCVLNVYAHSEMTMQNRTKGSSGEDTDAVTIDNNPLEGYMYQFKGVPITKINTTQYGGVPTESNELARLRHNGLILRGAANMGRPHWKEPPVPAIFQNCKNAKKLIINPGEINRTYLYDKWSGAFNTMCHTKLAAKKEIKQDDTGRIVSAPGKTTLFAMEEVINSGDLNPIKLQFQVQKTIGAYITVRKSPHILLQHIETAVVQSVGTIGAP